MAKRLTKGKRQWLLSRVRLLCDWDGPYWVKAYGWDRIQQQRRASAARAAAFLQRTKF